MMAGKRGLILAVILLAGCVAGVQAGERGLDAVVVLTDTAPGEELHLSNLLFDGRAEIRYRSTAGERPEDAVLPFSNLKWIMRQRFADPSLVAVDFGGANHRLATVSKARIATFSGRDSNGQPVSFNLSRVRLIVFLQGELVEPERWQLVVASAHDTLQSYRDYLNRFPNNQEATRLKLEIETYRSVSPRDLSGVWLRQKSAEVRGRVVRTQGYPNNAGAIDPLIECYNRDSEENSVRLAIVNAIGAIGSPAGEDFLVRVLREKAEGPTEVAAVQARRAAAARGLGRIGGERAVNFLDAVFAPNPEYPELVAEDDGGVIEAAIGALGGIGSAPAANSLIGIWEKFDPERATAQNHPFQWRLYRRRYSAYRDAAALALAACGPEALEILDRRANEEGPVGGLCREAAAAIRARQAGAGAGAGEE